MQLIGERYIGSLTGKTEEEQRQVLEQFREKNKEDNIKISIVPNLVDKKFIKMLKEYKVTQIELEIQSTNEYILKRCGYNYTIKEIKKATRMIKWNRIKVSFQVGIGLPDSTKIDELNTARELAKLRPNLVRIYPMLVMRNTRLEKEYNAGEYEPLTLNQAIERTKEVIYEFNRKKVKQISILKQNELNKSKGKGIVAGPYHEEFAQLVTDSIWYDSIVDKIKKFNVKVKKVKIEANPKEVPNIIGYEKENALKLEEFYNVEIQVEGNPDIKLGKTKISIMEVYSN